jgi:hypothetical protein
MVFISIVHIFSFIYMFHSSNSSSCFPIHLSSIHPVYHHFSSIQTSSIIHTYFIHSFSFIYHFQPSNFHLRFPFHPPFIHSFCSWMTFIHLHLPIIHGCSLLLCSSNSIPGWLVQFHRLGAGALSSFTLERVSKWVQWQKTQRKHQCILEMMKACMQNK